MRGIVYFTRGKPKMVRSVATNPFVAIGGPLLVVALGAKLGNDFILGAGVVLLIIGVVWEIWNWRRARKRAPDAASSSPATQVGPRIFHLQDDARIYGGNWDVRTNERPDGSADFSISALLPGPAVTRHPLMTQILEAYGAKVDGVADDTAPINRAIAHARECLVEVDRVQIIDRKTHEASNVKPQADLGI